MEKVPCLLQGPEWHHASDLCWRLDNPKTLCVRPLGCEWNLARLEMHVPSDVSLSPWKSCHPLPWVLCDADFYDAQVKFGHMTDGKWGWSSGPLCHREPCHSPPNPCNAAEVWLVSPQGAMLLGVTPHFPFSVRIHMGSADQKSLDLPWCGVDVGSPLRMGWESAWPSSHGFVHFIKSHPNTSLQNIVNTFQCCWSLLHAC